MEPVSPRESMAIFISRQVKNGDYVALGANLPVSAAGVLLAHLTHGPDIRLGILSYFTNLTMIESFDDLAQVANPKVIRWAEAVLSMEEQFDAIPRMDLCFTGCLQVDMYGNTNLIGVGRNHTALSFRGPGSVGTSTVMALVKKYIIHTGGHSPRVLVERCDFRSAVGWDEGGADARKRLGLPGGGPEFVITPKAVLDFEPEGKRLRLRHVLPPATLAEVVENVGFELLVPSHVEEMSAPTPSEIDVLRRRVDVKGILRH